MRYLLLPLTSLLIVFATTPLFPQTTLLDESFDSGQKPIGWNLQQLTPSVGWEFGSADALSTTIFDIPGNPNELVAASNDHKYDDATGLLNDASIDILMTPALNFSLHSGIILQFDYFQPGFAGSKGYVMLSTNTGGTWIQIHEVPSDPDWVREYYVDISLYSFAPNAIIGFKHDDGHTWGDGFAVDNVLIFSPIPDNADMLHVSVGDYVGVGNVDISFEIKNVGGNTITSLDAEFSVNGGAPVAENFSNMGMLPGGTLELTFTNQANLPTSGNYTIDVTVTKVNNNPDTDPSNNSGQADVFAMTVIPDKHVILYDFTGTWCPYCTDGIATMNDILGNQPNVIGVAAHNDSEMGFPDGDALIFEYVSGYPSGSIDLYKFGVEPIATSDRGVWASMAEERLDNIVPVEVAINSAGWNAATRQIDVTVRAEFFAPMSGDIRMNVYLLEDGVIADQANGYNNNSNHPFYNMGNPIIGFEHNHTLRAMLGGTWGLQGSIPASVTAGEVFFHTFSYTLPVNQDQNKINLVALVQNYDANDVENREIFNSIETSLPLWPTALDPGIPGLMEVKVFPNPFTERTTVRLSLSEQTQLNIQVTDLMGKTINVLHEGELPNGEHTFYWNGRNHLDQLQAGGIYFIQLISADGMSTQKVILNN